MDPFPIDRGVDAKIVVMGSAGVGKSSLLNRYVQNKFDPKNTTSTSGALFITKKVIMSGVKVRLQLWDTAGQERFRSMVGSILHNLYPDSVSSLPLQAPMYYRGTNNFATTFSLLTFFSGANAALLLYDITNASSFDDVRSWLLGPSIPLSILPVLTSSQNSGKTVTLIFSFTSSAPRLTSTTSVPSPPTSLASPSTTGFLPHSPRHLPRHPLLPPSPISVPVLLRSLASDPTPPLPLPLHLLMPTSISLLAETPPSSAARPSKYALAPTVPLPDPTPVPVPALPSLLISVPISASAVVGMLMAIIAVTASRKKTSMRWRAKNSSGVSVREWNCLKYPPRMTLVRVLAILDRRRRLTIIL